VLSRETRLSSLKQGPVLWLCGDGDCSDYYTSEYSPLLLLLPVSSIGGEGGNRYLYPSRIASLSLLCVSLDEEEDELALWL
jgi:hypothetical protein